MYLYISASNSPGVSDAVRARARNLHEQAINQTTRVQRIGRETQRISVALARSAAASQGPGDYVVDFRGNVTRIYAFSCFIQSILLLVCNRLTLEILLYTCFNVYLLRPPE